jgi:GGDEF domain-containing protein
LVGRLPEGFYICIAEAFTTQTCGMAERLQRVLESAPLPTPQGPVTLRCSLGIAFGRGPGGSAEDLMRRARAALAAAQEAGGSRIVTDS